MYRFTVDTTVAAGVAHTPPITWDNRLPVGRCARRPAARAEQRVYASGGYERVHRKRGCRGKRTRIIPATTLVLPLHCGDVKTDEYTYTNRTNAFCRRSPPHNSTSTHPPLFLAAAPSHVLVPAPLRWRPPLYNTKYIAVVVVETTRV